MSSEISSIDQAVSKVSFRVKKLGFLTVKGTLGEFSGRVSFDPKNPETAVFDVCLTARSIISGNAKRDKHLKSADFFDVDQHPKICFESRNVKQVNDQFQADGKLTLLGQSKEVSIPFTYDQGEFEGQFAINRQDFDLGKKFPSFIVGNTINTTITCKTK